MFGESLFSQLFGRVAHEVAREQTDPLTRMVMQWVADMQAHVLLRWRPVVESGIGCSLRPKNPRTGAFEVCHAPAIGACGFCRRPVCLHHALIGQNADLVCSACLSDYMRIVQERGGAPAGVGSAPEPPRSPAEQEMLDRRRYLKALGLREPVSWAIIHSAFRKKAARYHPDHAKPGKRAEAEAKFKQINEAYQWLRSRYEKAA
jgi:hypothetical protein